VRGTARAETRLSVERRYATAVAAALGWRPTPGEFHLFAVDLDDIAFVRYVDSTGDQYVTRWPRGGEFVRRGTSTTTLGAAETHRELLVD
jgi:hypothetical protein